MADLDRPGVIALLGRLGAESDAAVLEAARELHRKVGESGLTWDDLLRAEFGAAGADLEPADEPGEETPADDAPAEADGALPAADRAEVARLVDRLLARKNLSSAMREDLTEFKRTLAEGGLDAMDSRYIRALARRLGV
jgi:hypothetical protein